ncbi:hypothetical protein CATMQ487_21420 [Sphaerotilus microaerophilus]|uniref:Uncharacterized protein n=1 Tax=Sphaerotilus microaerophilus TaxID=2914710 RepID=A0ABN6PNL9_9BURK|nr:hypothetical protein CATMQ487_21420 [Sphaerotilus sp. FB-5]
MRPPSKFVHSAIFQLKIALKENEALISLIEAQSSASAPLESATTSQAIAVANVDAADSDPARDQALYVARIYVLGAMRELIGPTEVLLERLTELKFTWSSINSRVKDLERSGAADYIGLSAAIQRYALHMQLDYADEEIVLEERSLNLKFNLRNGKTMYLANMGGVRNYAGYAIALLLALHEAIDRQGGLGVGRFLFIDEMSQAFPSNGGTSDDSEGSPMSRALFTLKDACDQMGGRFQIILLESLAGASSIDRETLDAHLVEEWPDTDTGLVPASWSSV